MTILIVLASTGVGVGVALVVTGFFASTSVAKKMSFTKRIDPTTRHAALAALVGGAVLGLVASVAIFRVSMKRTKPGR